MNDRVSKRFGRKTGGKSKASEAIRAARAEAERLNPFHHEEPSKHIWLLPTCLAGAAGSLLVGAILLGLLSESAVTNGAFASINPQTGESAPPARALDRNIETASLSPQAEAPGETGDDTKAEGVMIVPERDLGTGFAYPEITSESLPYGDGKTEVLESEISIGAIDTDNITTIAKTPPPEPVDETFKLAEGDTLADALMERGVTNDTAQALAAAIDQVYPGRKIKPGTAIDLTLDQQQDFYGRYVIFPVQVSLRTEDGQSLKVEADEDGRFAARIGGADLADVPTPLAKPKLPDSKPAATQFRTRTRVGSSLYATAKDNRIPDYIVTELTRAFSYDVDFQRQVKASDSFEVFYGNPFTGSSTKRKVLHYAQLTLGGRTKTYYRFTGRDGKTDYYDENGRSAQKSLLRTPISGAKLTSGFGMRRHPLLGYSKMHTGTDFGAPYGTPIRAAGSGAIELAGRHGAYGITVKVQHNGKYETLYAHMSRLAPGIRSGRRVNQGQIIGYVGSTGRSTGPHLHYEVRVNDRPVNPTRISFAGGRALAGADLQRFRAFKSKVAEMMRKAPSATQVAQSEP